MAAIESPGYPLEPDEFALLVHFDSSRNSHLSVKQTRKFLRDHWGRADDARASAMLDDLCERGYLVKTPVGDEAGPPVDGYRLTLWGTLQIRFDSVLSAD